MFGLVTGSRLMESDDGLLPVDRKTSGVLEVWRVLLRSGGNINLGPIRVQ